MDLAHVVVRILWALVFGLIIWRMFFRKKVAPGSDQGVRGLFQAIPEVASGTVQIVSVAREPGVRTKVMVRSSDERVDPVGACVGADGKRIRAVVEALRGERVDIVPWDADPVRVVCNLMAPASVLRVTVDDERHAMRLQVADADLEKALGANDVNVRLSIELTGWTLEVVSETADTTPRGAPN